MKRALVGAVSVVLVAGVYGMTPLFAGPRIDAKNPATDSAFTRPWVGVTNPVTDSNLEYRQEMGVRVFKQETFEYSERPENSLVGDRQNFKVVTPEEMEIMHTEHQAKVDAFIATLTDSQKELFEACIGKFERPWVSGSERVIYEERMQFRMPMIEVENIPYMPTVEIDQMPNMPTVEFGRHHNRSEVGEHQGKTQHLERFGLEDGSYVRSQQIVEFKAELEALKIQIEAFVNSLTEEQKAMYNELFGIPRHAFIEKTEE